MDEERLAILKMIESGQVTAEEGAVLLAALDEQESMAAAEEEADLQEADAWMVTALLQVAEAVATSHDRDELLDSVVRITPLLAGVDRCTAFLWDRERLEFTLARSYGWPKEVTSDLSQLRLRPGDHPLFDEMLACQAPVIATELTADDGLPVSMAGDLMPKSALLAPLLTKGELLGALRVDYVNAPHLFNDKEVAILQGIASQAAVGLENLHLRQAELAAVQEKTRLAHELELARAMQQSLLPDRPPRLPGYALASVWRAAREMGGDFYDFIPLPHGRLGIVVADVCDKGARAAFFMALARSIVRTCASSGSTPAKVLKRANHLILADAREGMFVTLFYAILDPVHHLLTYANAGHNPAILIPGEWKTKNGRQERENGIREANDGAESEDHGWRGPLLTTRGTALGIIETAQFVEEQYVVQPGDTIVFYTDGIVDAVNPAMERYDESRLIDVLLQNRGMSPAEVIQAVTAAVAAFVGPAPQFDDATQVVLQRLKS